MARRPDRLRRRPDAAEWARRGRRPRLWAWARPVLLVAALPVAALVSILLARGCR